MMLFLKMTSGKQLKLKFKVLFLSLSLSGETTSSLLFLASRKESKPCDSSPHLGGLSEREEEAHLS